MNNQLARSFFDGAIYLIHLQIEYIESITFTYIHKQTSHTHFSNIYSSMICDHLHQKQIITLSPKK